MFGGQSVVIHRDRFEIRRRSSSPPAPSRSSPSRTAAIAATRRAVAHFVAVGVGMRKLNSVSSLGLWRHVDSREFRCFALQLSVTDSAQQITMLYFAGARTSLPNEPNSESISLPTTPFPLSGLRQLLAERYGGNIAFASVLQRSAWSVNEEMIQRDEESSTLLLGGEVVGIIPGVSGG